MTDRNSFAHLHVHTEFSMLDGASRVDEVVAAAAADGQPALGITDHGNMYGVLPFYAACRAAGITPVIGFEAYMAHDHRAERINTRGKIDDTGGEGEGGQEGAGDEGDDDGDGEAAHDGPPVQPQGQGQKGDGDGDAGQEAVDHAPAQGAKEPLPQPEARPHGQKDDRQKEEGHRPGEKEERPAGLAEDGREFGPRQLQVGRNKAEERPPEAPPLGAEAGRWLVLVGVTGQAGVRPLLARLGGRRWTIQVGPPNATAGPGDDTNATNPHRGVSPAPGAPTWPPAPGIATSDGPAAPLSSPRQRPAQ